MPKLIIPNIHELYKPDDALFTQTEAIARQHYHLRFLWSLQPGDVILLANLPSTDFFNYFTAFKKIDPQTITLIAWGENELTIPFSSALACQDLRQKLAKKIKQGEYWSIQTCYFNQTVKKLADHLNIPMDQTWRDAVDQDIVRKLNSKRLFRQLAASNHIPIPAGKVCYTQEELLATMQELFRSAEQLIIKQEYNGGGRGNLGVTTNENHLFYGITQKELITEQNISLQVKKIWEQWTNKLNPHLIIEVYYPRSRTFTTMISISSRSSKPTFLHHSEIRMENIWVGVEIPAHRLSLDQAKTLADYSLTFAQSVQQYEYRGFICCDAILTEQNEILFTEINVRPGAETNAYEIASHLYGENYTKEATILTRRGLRITNFKEAYQKLAQENLLLDSQKKSGVALLTVDEKYTKEIEYLIAAPTLAIAQQLEQKVLKTI